MTEYRNVVDRTEGDWEHGHRERRDEETWEHIPRSEYMKNVRRFWFQKTPVEIMREDIGFETSFERASEFENGSDNDPAIWYYLALASRDHGFLREPSDEPLKWIMSALAAEANARGLRFIDIPKLLPAHYLSWFAYAIRAGEIDRTFTKVIFAELLKLNHLPFHDPNAGLQFNTLIKESRFKPVDESVIDNALDAIIAANPDQFDKARENPKLVQWFVGQTMKATQGKASAPIIIAKMQERINAAA